MAGLAYVAMLGLFSFGHDHDVGGHDHAAGDHPAEHTPTVSVFSPKVIAIFMVGFGAAGFMASELHQSIFPATAWAAAGGAVIGGLAYAGLRLLYSQQVSSEVMISRVVGKTGTVTVTIPTDGVGEVSLTIDGQYLTYAARCAVVCPPIHVGSQVSIVRYYGSTLVVS